MNTFESLLAELAKANIRFILLGGLAVELAGFTRMSGRDYADLLPYTRPYPIQNITITSLTAEGLILLKSGSPRPKDQIDVAELRRIIGR